ncbi:ChbG/HpnK family deacetylase [Pseudomonas wadenswilerensis]
MSFQVIVNADDFGLNEPTNAVILRAFQSGVISSATAMANMPAFRNACALARQQPMLRGRVGLHFNLSHGRPLSEAILEEPALCNEAGEFEFSLSRKCLWLSRRTRQAVELELAAQWQHCLGLGLLPSHLDSHQHVHNVWPIGEIVARFAAREGVPVRLARNIGRNIGAGKRAFKTLLNRRLRQLARGCADHVCTPVDLRDGLAPRAGILEVVVHPSALGCADFGDAYLESGESLMDLLEQRLEGVQRVGYGALAGRALPQAAPAPTRL